jgi:very-short-patch-repair endonuclease
MSAREPRDPGADREQRRTHPPADRAFDVPPAQRDQRRTRGGEDGAFDELPGQGSAELGIARIATSQNGAVTHAQLVETGLGHSGIGRRSDRGLLHRIHRGVYVVGHEAFAPHAREAAAILAVGEQTVVSHYSAAILWGLATTAVGDHDIDVMVIGRRPRRRPGLHLHYASTLDPRDIRRLDGLPLTAPARTLFDLAATGYPQLERAFGEAHAQRLVTAREIEDLLERAGPRAGTRALRALESDNASGFTRSQAERLLRALLRSANLPMPRFNARVAGYEVDAVWPQQRLVVEVDGYGYHGHRAQFERDRRKDLALTAAGYRVIRVSWRQLTNEPLALVAVISAALSLGREPG